MDSAVELLQSLDKVLREKRPDYYPKLQVGVSEEKFKEFEKSTGLLLTADFKALYRWKNGQQNSVLGSFFQNYMFMGLSTAQHLWADLKKEQGYGTPDWIPGLVPVFDNGGGDYWLVDLGRGSKTLGLAYLWYHDDHDEPMEPVETLMELLELVLECNECDPPDIC